MHAIFIRRAAAAAVCAAGLAGCNRTHLINAETHLLPKSARMLDDPNILGALMDADSSEVVIARNVRDRLTEARYRAFAQTLIDDHSRSLAELHSLVTQEHLDVDRPPIDTIPRETTHLIDRFNGLTGAVLDTAFLNHAVRDHHMGIGDTQKLEEWAKNPDLKAEINRTLPVLEKHLRIAERLGGHS